MKPNFNTLKSQTTAYADGAPAPSGGGNNTLAWLDTIGRMVDSVGGAFKNIGGAFKKDTTDPNAPFNIPPAPKNNTTMWIVVGLVVIGVIGGLVWYLKKK